MTSISWRMILFLSVLAGFCFWSVEEVWIMFLILSVFVWTKYLTYHRLKESRENMTPTEQEWLRRLSMLLKGDHKAAELLVTDSKYLNTVSVQTPMLLNEKAYISVQRLATQQLSPETFHALFLEKKPDVGGAKWLLLNIGIMYPFALMLFTLALFALPLPFFLQLAVMLSFSLAPLLWKSQQRRMNLLVEFKSYQSFSARKYLLKTYQKQYQVPGKDLKPTLRKFAHFGTYGDFLPRSGAMQAVVLVAMLCSALSFFLKAPTAKQLPPTAAGQDETR